MPNRRVLVTSPRTTAATRRRRPATQEIDDQTGIGAAYMQTLIRSQRRLAVLVLGVLGVVVASLPLLFHATDVRDMQVAGLPLPWLVLGALIYPLLVALGWFYVRQADRVEHEFSELVERE